MKRSLLITGLLATYVAYNSSSDPLTYSVPPPPLIRVQIRDIELAGVCLLTGESYLLYSRPQGSGYSSLATWAANGAQVYNDLTVHSENCLDSSTQWPDQAVGTVKAAVSTSGERYAELVIGARSLDQCTLNVHLKLRGVPPLCAPLDDGIFASCGCPEIYTDFKAP
jgi:hypothetical protein